VEPEKNPSLKSLLTISLVMIFPLYLLYSVINSDSISQHFKGNKGTTGWNARQKKDKESNQPNQSNRSTSSNKSTISLEDQYQLGKGWKVVNKFVMNDKFFGIYNHRGEPFIGKVYFRVVSKKDGLVKIQVKSPIGMYISSFRLVDCNTKRTKDLIDFDNENSFYDEKGKRMNDWKDPDKDMEPIVSKVCMDG